MANLEIQIGADSSELNSEIAAAESKIKRLGKLKVERVKLGLDVKELNSDINQAKAQLTSLNKATQATGQSFNAMTPKVANGGNALMQFSRIAQDAPYGIIGIGNNITATVEAFGHLKNSTGSTGGALKALAGSIIGSGGILLAVSLVTTALTYMSQNNISVGDVLDKLSGNFDNLKKSMTDVNNEAQKNASAEISSMNALVSISKDENNTRQERLSAVKKLQDEYPAYFGNLTKEQILNGNVETATKAVANALIQKAKATVLATKISENELKILELQQKGQKEVADFVSGKGLFAILKGVTGQQAFKASADATSKSIDNLKKEQALFTKELEKSTKASNTFEIANTKASKSKSTKASIATTKKEGKYKNPNPNFNAGNGFIGGGIVNPNLGLVTPDLGVDEAAIEANEKLRLGLEMQKKTLEDFNKSASEIIEGGITDTFAGLGSAIGGALASGGNVIQAAGSALLAGVGELLINLGKMAIQVGVGLSGIKAALKTLNPAVAISAGVALIALGSVFSSKASALGSSGGSSGGSGGSVSTGASVSSPTSSTGGGGGSSFQGGTVVFEISGQSLIGVLGNTLDRNRRLGGSLGLG